MSIVERITKLNYTELLTYVDIYYKLFLNGKISFEKEKAS